MKISHLEIEYIFFLEVFVHLNAEWGGMYLYLRDGNVLLRFFVVSEYTQQNVSFRLGTWKMIKSPLSCAPLLLLFFNWATFNVVVA